MTTAETKLFVYVEDDPQSRNIMRLMMERVVKNCTLMIWQDGVDFLKNLVELPHIPDMILLDIHMTPFDGFALLKQVRSESRYDKVPVVALTASVMNEEVERLKQSGFSGVIAKPVSPMTFPGLLNRLLNQEQVWYVTE